MGMPRETGAVGAAPFGFFFFFSVAGFAVDARGDAPSGFAVGVALGVAGMIRW